MKDRKQLSIPAETHDALFAYLEMQEKETGLRVTASSFAERAIKQALEDGSELRSWFKKE